MKLSDILLPLLKMEVVVLYLNHLVVIVSHVTFFGLGTNFGILSL